MYKICQNPTNLLFDDYFQYHKTNYNLHQHGWTLQFLSSKLLQFTGNTGKFFANHILPIWNILPDIVVSAPNLFLFKKRFSEFDLHGISVADLMF